MPGRALSERRQMPYMLGEEQCRGTPGSKKVQDKKMSLRRRQVHFWIKVSMVIQKAYELSKPIVILCWTRTREEQEYLVSIGRSKTLDSMHLYGLAVDFCFIDDLEDDGTINWHPDKYKELGESKGVKDD
jgi:hypothetical protein